jgi:hypothetical protein
MIEHEWSIDRQWLAFGIAGGDQSIFMWRPGTPTATGFSPDGTSFTPAFDWSADGTKLAMYLSNDSGGGLYLVTVSDAGVGAAQIIDAGSDVSPADWNGYGALSYGLPDAGWLLPVDDDGTPGTAIDFPGYSSCGVVWLNESQYFHTGCQAENGLTFGEVEGGAITTTELASAALGQLALSPDHSCLLEWSTDAIQVGAADATNYAPNLIKDGTVVSFPSFSEGGAGLVYIALGVSIQHYDLDGCTPADEPLQRVASGIVTDSMLLTTD